MLLHLGADPYYYNRNSAMSLRKGEKMKSIESQGNETPTVRGLAADNNNKLYTETMIFLWNNHYILNFIM